jgi:hypothetical protein
VSVGLCRNLPELRLNAICPYYTMFPLSFPYTSLSQAKEGDWVLDPFCGRGTTNFAARLLSLPSVGVDESPVAWAITAAKVIEVSPQEVIDEAESILRTAGVSATVPGDHFWRLAYHPETLQEICRLRESLMVKCDTAPRIVLRALVLGVLHGPLRRGRPSYLSNQMPRTYATKPGSAVRFWEARGLQPERVDVLDVLSRRARFTLHSTPKTSDGSAVLGDSRRPTSIPAVSGGYRWVITSPPYFGMRSYRPDQWLRLWFLGGPSTVSYDRREQIPHVLEEYMADLSQVWSNVAAKCAPGARLVVRFGAIPSSPRSPRECLLSTLARSDSGWRVQTVEGAGSPPPGMRQARQFAVGLGKAIEEIEVRAVLES